MKKLKAGVREEEEAELLDVIWSLQYHIDTILSLSVGEFFISLSQPPPPIHPLTPASSIFPVWRWLLIITVTHDKQITSTVRRS
jgi:hypothetical protein